jgi:uroporphyrin-III C-methyltransferase
MNPSEGHPVLLVGAGPGDPELLTRKALRAIRRATVILADDLVSPACLRLARRGCRIVHVGKRGGCASTPQEFIQRLMVAEARRGERVVRLKGGDPGLFGRSGEEIAHLRAAGIEVEVIPGITAGVAAAAAAATPLTHREHCHGVAFVAGHTADALGVDWAALARSRMTLVIYMGMSGAGAIRRALLDGGMEPRTPALLLQSVGTAEQRRLDTRLDTLESDLRASGLASPCVMMIGAAFEAALDLVRAHRDTPARRDFA